MRVLKKLTLGAASLVPVACSRDLLVQLRSLQSSLSPAEATFRGWLHAFLIVIQRQPRFRIQRVRAGQQSAARG